MSHPPLATAFTTFCTCPPSKGATAADYIRDVIEISRWSDDAGCEGILVYTDNGLVDPWLLAQVIIENTTTLCPLVAVQPVYMHPYTVAKKLSTFGYLYGRRLWINMVAGGFKNDLLALNDETEHDERYVRLVEYTSIIQELLRDGRAVTFDGQYYQVKNVELTPPLPEELYPGITISGSSEAGLNAARAVGATAVRYPRRVDEHELALVDKSVNTGIRVGIVTREDSEEAWQVARTRFPEDRKGQLTHQLAMKVSDSFWHKQLSDLGKGTKEEEDPYWLVPFENYKTFCPYLVGSYERVATEVARYVNLGDKAFILDVPASAEELRHIGTVFEMARSQTAGLVKTENRSAARR